jgi:hypothetical protein
MYGMRKARSHSIQVLFFLLAFVISQKTTKLSSYGFLFETRTTRNYVCFGKDIHIVIWKIGLVLKIKSCSDYERESDEKELVYRRTLLCRKYNSSFANERVWKECLIDTTRFWDHLNSAQHSYMGGRLETPNI